MFTKQALESDGLYEETFAVRSCQGALSLMLSDPRRIGNDASVWTVCVYVLHRNKKNPILIIEHLFLARYWLIAL